MRPARRGDFEMAGIAHPYEETVAAADKAAGAREGEAEGLLLRPRRGVGAPRRRPRRGAALQRGARRLRGDARRDRGQLHLRGRPDGDRAHRAPTEPPREAPPLPQGTQPGLHRHRAPRPLPSGGGAPAPPRGGAVRLRQAGPPRAEPAAAHELALRLEPGRDDRRCARGRRRPAGVRGARDQAIRPRARPDRRELRAGGVARGADRLSRRDADGRARALRARRPGRVAARRHATSPST